MRILLIDNYDSFTYNLVHYLEKLSDIEVDVIRNDEIDLDSIQSYSHIVLSPGPGLPNEANQLMEIIEKYANTKNILGVCLGHQAIAQYFGSTLSNLPTVVHGEAKEIEILNQDELFKNLPTYIKVGRYHSWVIKETDLSKSLNATAVDSEQNVMAFKHHSLPIFGIQFHPESILTDFGEQMISNWLKL